MKLFRTRAQTMQSRRGIFWNWSKRSIQKLIFLACHLLLSIVSFCRANKMQPPTFKFVADKAVVRFIYNAQQFRICEVVGMLGPCSFASLDYFFSSMLLNILTQNFLSTFVCFLAKKKLNFPLGVTCEWHIIFFYYIFTAL